jgi:hypothetical protein
MNREVARGPKPCGEAVPVQLLLDFLENIVPEIHQSEQDHTTAVALADTAASRADRIQDKPIQTNKL